MTHRGPFWPWTFCDSVKWSKVQENHHWVARKHKSLWSVHNIAKTQCRKTLSIIFWFVHFNIYLLLRYNDRLNLLVFIYVLIENCSTSSFSEQFTDGSDLRRVWEQLAFLLPCPLNKPLLTILVWKGIGSLGCCGSSKGFWLQVFNRKAKLCILHVQMPLCHQSQSEASQGAQFKMFLRGAPQWN